MKESSKKHGLETVGSGLAAYATKPQETRGRLVPEPPSSTRTEFQRDRDRIIHSGAFRKLRNKTQVFVENEGDYYRTRLTHSMEVAQIARSIARVLGINEDLTEAIALAHDLGHTCFGHTGERALAVEMENYGGFCHNEQTFRVLTQLEHNYAKFDGLNLTWETLEGVAKHNGPLMPANDGEILPKTIEDFNSSFDLELDTYAGLEAQVAAAADDIAYNTHDIDDGFRAGCFSFDDMKKLPLFGPALEETQRRYPDMKQDRIVHEAVREVIGLMVLDIIRNTQRNLAALDPKSVVEVRKAKVPFATFSAGMKDYEKTIRAFLTANMYRHPKVMQELDKAEHIVRDLFKFFMEKPNELPEDWSDRLKERSGDNRFKARLVADYVAGMTDPFAAQEHQRLFSPKV